MQHAHNLWLRPNLIRGFLTTGYLSLILASCTSTPTPTTIIHQDPRSEVFLQAVSNRSFQAAHPLKLDELTVADILRGVHTREKTEIMVLLGKALKATTAQSISSTFSEDDIALLTPSITAALAQATPNQQVGFRLTYPPTLSSRSKKAAVETTAGYLFADGLSLHFTLTLYHQGAGKTDTVERAVRQLPDATGLRDREVTFVPEAAVRPEPEDSGFLSGSDGNTVVIDYQLLAKLMATPPPAPVPVAQPLQPSPPLPAPAGKSDPDLQAFKEELKALQKKVDEQNAELQKLKKSAPKRKSNP